MAAHASPPAAAVLTMLVAGQAAAQAGGAPLPPASAPAPPAVPMAAPGYPPYPAYPPQPSPSHAYPPGYPAYPPAYPYPPQRQQGPKQLPYHEGQAIPPGYYLDEGIRRGPVIAGTIVFAVPYAIGLSIASGFAFEESTGWLALPVAGPWIAWATREDRCEATTVDEFESQSDCEDERAIRTLLVLDGLMQATGATLAIWGLSSRKKRLLRDDVSRIVVSPRRVGRGWGLGIVGSF